MVGAESVSPVPGQQTFVRHFSVKDNTQLRGKRSFGPKERLRSKI